MLGRLVSCDRGCSLRLTLAETVGSIVLHRRPSGTRFKVVFFSKFVHILSVHMFPDIPHALLGP